VKKATVLLVDDAPEMLEILQRMLNALQYHTFQSTNVRDAIDILEESAVDLLITDLRMPGRDGMHLVRYAARHFPSVPILVVTGYPSVSGAVAAIKSGAVEYLVKPFTGNELKEAVAKTLAHQTTTDSPKVPASPSAIPGLIGASEVMQDVVDLIRRISNLRVTVLIQGESGTGKEVVARAIHQHGDRKKAPFIAVNCAAIPENLLESELFGVVKGAFTGAQHDRSGFFEAANGGTIFLDEIGSASPAVQARLLRVIQEKEINRVGSHQSISIDVRIIAATNVDLQEQMATGNFRQDLYYRLNVVAVDLPPLRNRGKDILLLAEHFVRHYSREFGRSEPRLTGAAAEVLLAYHWPGNVRELENLIQRALILAKADLGPEHFPAYLSDTSPERRTRSDLLSLKEVEYHHICKVLEATNNNKTRAAEILGINRKTLRQKLKEGDESSS